MGGDGPYMDFTTIKCGFLLEIRNHSLSIGPGPKVAGEMLARIVALLENTAPRQYWTLNHGSVVALAFVLNPPLGAFRKGGRNLPTLKYVKDCTRALVTGFAQASATLPFVDVGQSFLMTKW